MQKLTSRTQFREGEKKASSILDLVSEVFYSMSQATRKDPEN